MGDRRLLTKLKFHLASFMRIQVSFAEVPPVFRALFSVFEWTEITLRQGIYKNK